MARAASKALLAADLLLTAITDWFRKRDPRKLVRNPVMFVTAAVAVLLTVLLVVRRDGLSTASRCS